MLLKEFILGDLALEKPSKVGFSCRKEDFGAVIFNKENLRQAYVDKDCFNLLEAIDSKKTVGELVDFCSKGSLLRKILLSGKFHVYLKSLKENGFIELNCEIPEYYSPKISKPPLTSAPNQISWLITNQCNLHCSHCGNSSKVKLKNEFSTVECKDFIDQCAESKVFVLNISGGEPFLRKDLFGLVNYARNKGIEVAITTNATMVNEKTIKKIKKMDCFNIHLSLDGVGKVHDSFRNKPGLFKQLKKAIRLFKKEKIPFGITTSITKFNFKKLDEVKKFILSEKIGSWEIYYALPVGCLKKTQSLSPEEFVGLARKVEKIRQELKGKSNVFVGDSLGYYGNCDLRDGAWAGCLAGLNHCAIDAEGNVKGCPIQSEDFIEGNLRNSSLVEIWRKPGAFAYNRSERKLEGYCKKCAHSKECRAGCTTSMFAQGNSKLSENKLCIEAIEGKKAFDVLY